MADISWIKRLRGRRVGAETIGPGPSRYDPTGTPIVEFSPQVVSALGIGPLGNSTSLGEVYRTQPAVRICVDFLAENIAQLNLKTYRRTGANHRPEEPQHPAAQLLQRPNPRTTRYELMRGTVADMAIYDNAYWLKQFRTSGTNTTERRLYRIPPMFISPRGGDIITGPSVYKLSLGGASRDFDPSEIVHFRGYNPIDPRVGNSVLESLVTVLREESAASEHRRGFWRNAARRDGVIERPMDAPEWDDGAQIRFRADWQNRTAGSGNAGITPVLEDGMKWVADSFSPRDSEFIAGREFTIDTVATAYHIPLAVLSRKSTATFASMREFHKALYVDTLGPWNAMFEGAIALQLLPDFKDPDIYVEVNIEEKLQGDFETQAAAIRESVQVPWMSVNDARALRNMPRVDDPVFDVPARPANYLFGDEAPAATPPQTVPRLAPAALNGHGDIVPDDLEALESILDGGSYE